LFKYAYAPLLFLCFFLCFRLPAKAQNDTIRPGKTDSIAKISQQTTPNDSIKTNTYDFEKEFRASNPFKFPAQLKPKRLAISLSIEGSLYAATLLGLNNLWYEQYRSSKFHFFDDSKEWLQMDKFGHFTSSSTIANLCYYSYRWSGMKHKKAVLYAGAASLAYMTTIEVLDGYSSGWGFSVSDMVANVLGTSFFVTQQLLWQRQYIKTKLSYHPTSYAGLRPEELGENASQRILKDYNGLTIWASLGSAVFVPKRSHFPRWICLSFGYGAEGMLGGFFNPDVNEAGQNLPQFDRYRQFYLSLDVDFSVIKTKSKIVKLLLLAVNAIKIPFPALEYNTKGQFKFHYLYF
jgi:hypothetical protein